MKKLCNTHLSAMSLAAVALLVASSAFSQSDAVTAPAYRAKLPDQSQGKLREAISYDLETGYSYVGNGDVKSKTSPDNLKSNSDQHEAFWKLTSSIQVAKYTFVRAGIETDNYFFGSAGKVPMPDRLGQTNLIVGLDTALSNHLLMRLEVSPGIYSDYNSISSEDFMAPVLLGFSYLVNDKLQFMAGIMINADSELPVMGGVGMRWQVSDQWTLNLVFPNPRVEFALSDSVTLFAGGDFKGGTYRVSNDFGRGYGEHRLNNAVVDFSEIRTGAGAKWQVMPSLALETEVGASVDRQWDFHRAGYRVEGDVAPYVSLSANGKF